MSSKIPFPSLAPGVGWLRFWLPLSALLLCGSAFAQDIDVSHKQPCPTQTFKFAFQKNVDIDTPPPIAVIGGGAGLCTPTNAAWTFANVSGCSTSPPYICNGITVTVPTGTNPVPSSAATVTISGTPTAAVPSTFTLNVTGECNGSITNIYSCPATYLLHATATGGGWGEPHISTVDNAPFTYDFQAAGEFTALRGREFERGKEFERGEEFELQTRQTAFPSPFTPTDSYTGLTSCLSIYTAVATRVGKHRVTYEPDISGDPDPSGMQLRVDGKLRKLGPEGIDLASEGPSDEDEDEDERARRGKYQPRQHSTAPAQGAIVERRRAGRIVPIGGGFEIDYADGTTLLVTPPSPWIPWINVLVSGTTATKGIMGLTKDGWLPALPDGASLGPKPAALHDRYVQLYEKFANAWRVTEETSLFDYAPGTSTHTFTNRKYPGENPSSCAIEGQPTARPMDVHVAEKHCSAVVDKNKKANCIFDVSATGNPGVAKSYETLERLQPGLTETTVKDDTDPTKIGDSVTFTATVLPALARGGGVPAGNVQFIVDDSKAGDPVTLDTIGRVAWSTSNLQAGEHHVVAKYNPRGFGEPFLASSSPKICHTVEGGSDSHPNPR